MTEKTPDPMKKFEDDEALFDTKRAEELKMDFMERFSSNSNLVERFTYIYVTILCFATIYFWSKVAQSEDTKTQIAFAALFVAMFCGTMVMKMWFWMMHVKFSLLKEMKLMRWEIIRGASAKFETPETEKIGLSMTERVVWVVGILAVIIVMLVNFPVTL